MTFKNEYTIEPAFINKERELNYLKNWITERPNTILLIYGPKSSGKTTLLYRFVDDIQKEKRYEIKFFNLREILVANYRDFIQTFFEIDYSKSRADVKERREYDLKVFKLSVELLKGLESKDIDPFVIMKKELVKIESKGIRPVIIIDELQALENIYMNSQRELIKELINFFVAITKESHLCHVMLSSSDGYFVERIHTDSKLKKASCFLEVDYLNREDVCYWLSNIERESKITLYKLTEQQINAIWDSFGGSCWEISRFLGDLLMIAKNGAVNDIEMDKILEKTLTACRSLFEEYAGLDESKDELFKEINNQSMEKGFFKEKELARLVREQFYNKENLKDELINLVRNNFISYDPANAKYKLQGRSMELGLNMFVNMLQ